MGECISRSFKPVEKGSGSMSLYNEFMVPCVWMEKSRVPDLEGGFLTNWVEGPEFQAAIAFSSSVQSRRAEKEGVSSLYRVTTNKKVKLEYHDVFKRLSDGKVFRVTSDGDDLVSPGFSEIDTTIVTAEEWSLT